MSIGKNSIARAAGSKTTAPKQAVTAPVVATTEHISVATAAVTAFASAAPTAADKAPSTLLNSVRRRGILEPLLLVRVPDGTLYILEGYRRLDAAKALGLDTVPAVVVAADSENDALRLFDEVQGTRRATADVREGKFRAAAMTASDLPTYLL